MQNLGLFVLGRTRENVPVVNLVSDSLLRSVCSKRKIVLCVSQRTRKKEEESFLHNSHFFDREPRFGIVSGTPRSHETQAEAEMIEAKVQAASDLRSRMTLAISEGYPVIPKSKQH